MVAICMVEKRLVTNVPLINFTTSEAAGPSELLRERQKGSV